MLVIRLHGRGRALTLQWVFPATEYPAKQPFDSKLSQTYIIAMTSPPRSFDSCHCSVLAVIPPKSLLSITL